MDTEIRDTLVEEIRAEFAKLSSMEPGTAEHTAAVKSLETLYKLNIEDTAREREFMEKCDRDIDREREWKLKNAQLEEQKLERYFSLGIGLAGIILTPILTYRCNMGFAKKICNFELTETFTSSPGKAMSRGLFRFMR